MAYAVTASSSLPVREGAWDGDKARADLFAWATEGDDADLARAARGHTVADIDPEGRDATRADLKLPICYVEDGELIAIGDGLRLAIGTLPRAEGLSDAVREEAKALLEGLLGKLTVEDAADESLIEMANRVLNDADESTGARLTALKILADHGAPARRSWLDSISAAPARTDGAVFRCDRIPFEVAPRAAAAIDRAIDIAGRRVDDEAITLIADELRRDGLDEYLTPEGYFLCKVRAARTGVQVYGNGVTEWGEMRSEDEVRASLPTWGLRPMSNDHPPVLVTPDNYAAYAVGSTGQDAALVGPESDGHKYVELTIMVGDIGALRSIRDGKLELSAGYTVVPVERPGRAPDGTRYRYLQTKICINHLALVDRGRAGPLARIELDGAAWQLVDNCTKDTTMTRDQILKTALDTMRKDDAPEDYVRGAMMMLEAAISGEPMTAESIASLTEMLSMGGGEMVEEGAVEMDIAPGLKIKLTADQAKVWEAHSAKVATDADGRTALDAKLTKLTESMSSMQAVIDSQASSIAASDSRVAAADRSTLIAEARAVSPTLVEAWDKRASSEDEAQVKAFDAMTALDLKVEFLRDLGDAILNDGLKAAKGPGFETYVDTMFKTQLRLAQGRKAAHDGGGDGGTNSDNTGKKSVNDAIRDNFYN